MSILADGSAALVTKVTPENPSPNGVHVLNAKQIERLCTRTLGFNNPLALKHGITLANGGATLTIDAELCKVGQAWKNEKTGESGIYGHDEKGVLKADAKDWTKYSNHELKLGYAATNKMFEMALSFGMASIQSPVVAAPVQKVQPAFGIANTTSEQEEEKA